MVLKKRSIALTFLTLFLSLFCFSSYSFSAALPDDKGIFSVTYVIDGDTVVLKNGDKVRYLGINTPERNEFFYKQARNFNIKMLAGKKIRLEICPEQKRDKYGRLLATVFADGVNVCRELVKGGFARVLSIPPCAKDKHREYSALQKSAILQKVGLWKGEKIITCDEAKKYTGERISVTGKVLEFHKGKKAIFFNFGKDYRNDFSFVVFLKYLDNFTKFGINPVSEYPGHMVMVRGVVKEYNGPEILIFYPSDVAVLD